MSEQRDIWGNIKGIVRTVAPVLGNAILPGVGGVAGTLIAEFLGVEDKPEAIEAALKTATPETLWRLRELEARHKENLITLGIESAKLYIQDVQSARSREVEVVKATGKVDVNLYALAWLTVTGFFVLCGLLLFKVVPEGQSNILYLLIGGLVANFTQVYNYFFGSSKSSTDKTALLSGRK